jgi:lysophospholipase L1-like esterase
VTKRFALLAAIAGLIAAATTARSSAEPVYIAIGDSSAFGETDRTHNPSNGNRGYVSMFANYLGQKYYGGNTPIVANFAIDGETSKSFFSGKVSDRASDDGVFHNTNYARYAPNYPSQNTMLLNRVTSELARGNTIAAITVQVGANDLFKVGEADGFTSKSATEQRAIVTSAITQYQQMYAQLLGEIRSILPNTALYVLGYANPFAATPEHPFHALAAEAVQGVDQVSKGLANYFGASYVDVYSAFLGHEADWTLIKSGNYNVHPNDQGYRVIGEKLILASAPEPSSIVLIGVGIFLALGACRMRRDRARLVA